MTVKQDRQAQTGPAAADFRGPLGSSGIVECAARFTKRGDMTPQALNMLSRPALAGEFAALAQVGR
jgi:hypothetical protein